MGRRSLSSDAGLLLYCELDEALGLGADLEEMLEETRTAKHIQHSLTALLRQSVYGRLAEYEDSNDAEVAVPRELFKTILQRIEQLRLMPVTG